MRPAQWDVDAGLTSHFVRWKYHVKEGDEDEMGTFQEYAELARSAHRARAGLVFSADTGELPSAAA